MASRIKALTCPLIFTLLAVTMLLGEGCDEQPVDPDDHSGMGEVVFRVAWPSPSLNKASNIPNSTSALAIRIAKSTDKLRDGTVAHVTRSDTIVTMFVEPGSDYDVEVLCLVQTPNYLDSYSPIGYGISEGLVILPDTTNYVTVTVDTLDLTFVRNDTLVAGDTLSVALTLELDDYWSDFEKYIPTSIKCDVNDPNNVIGGNSVTLKETSRNTVGATFEWQSTIKKSGMLEFFIAGSEGDKLTDLTTAFKLTIWTAWRPSDFMELGDRFTILITGGSMVVITIPR